MITTFTVAGDELQPFSNAVTAYIPLIAVVVLVLSGFWIVVLNPEGPVQTYVTPGVAELDLSSSFNPEHKGLLAVTTGVSGAVGLTSVNSPSSFEVQPFLVTAIAS